jgi:hypothetical protein
MALHPNKNQNKVEIRERLYSFWPEASIAENPKIRLRKQLNKAIYSNRRIKPKVMHKIDRNP